MQHGERLPEFMFVEQRRRDFGEADVLVEFNTCIFRTLDLRTKTKPKDVNNNERRRGKKLEGSFIERMNITSSVPQ